MDETLRLLAVFPHPDDETLGMGSTLARYAAEGIEIHLLCATRGERGWFDSEGPNPGLEELGRIRIAELLCAAEALGIHEVHFLDYIDGEVDQADPEEIIRKIVAHIRRIKPHVVVTFSPDGAYGHPDHIALSQFTSGALVCAVDESYVDAEVQPSHCVCKFYYMVDSPEVVSAVEEALGGISMEVDGIIRQHVAWPNWEITTRVDTHQYVSRVQKALQCHKSQLPGYRVIVEWSLEQLATVYDTGCFYRAYSLVNGGRKLEIDLFEGLR